MASFYCELGGSSGTVDPQPAIIGQSFALLVLRMDRRAGIEARGHGCHHCLRRLQCLGPSGHRAVHAIDLNGTHLAMLEHKRAALAH